MSNRNITVLISFSLQSNTSWVERFLPAIIFDDRIVNCTSVKIKDVHFKGIFSLFDRKYILCLTLQFLFYFIFFFTYNIKQASELRTLMCSVDFLCLINSMRKKFLSWSFIIHGRFLSVYAGDLSDWGSALSQVASALSVWLPDLKQPACQMVLNYIYLLNK